MLEATTGVFLSSEHMVYGAGRSLCGAHARPADRPERVGRLAAVRARRAAR